MTVQRPVLTGDMPPLNPLDFPKQVFNRPYRDRGAPVRLTSLGAGVIWARIAVFLPALVVTGALMEVFLNWFAKGGLSWPEIVLAAMIGFGTFWIALSLATALLGAGAMLRRRPRPGPVTPLDVALLMPIYNEAPQMTFGNAAAMLEALYRPAGKDGAHRFALYMLSDTRDPKIALQEEIAFASLRAALPAGIRLYYRRRTENTDRKVGNLANWVTHWGGAHDAMLVLDADSLMSARAIRDLADALGSDPEAGLIQSFPQLIGAHTVFGRAQEFANSTYGAALANGLALWTGQEGNYWGHNAIIRTKAFAASAGLPRLRGGDLILSHDFVEAGLMRRAGWAVRFVPQIEGSWEETPPALLDYVARDRRWCQGNLQHLRLLRTRGFHGLSRFHLLHGAVGYLLSPLWFALLVIWALIGTSETQSVIAYFTPEMPLRPTWPEMGSEGHLRMMLLIYCLLLAPKFVGLAVTLMHPGGVRRVGGAGRLAAGFVAEVILSVLYAPVLMVQQTRAVLGVTLGRRVDWTPQARAGSRYPLGALLRAHWLETVLGAALLLGIVAGLVALWLLPVAMSLLLAVPLSWLSARPARAGWLATPQSLHAPAIRRSALRWQVRLDQVLRLGGTPAE